eukprot:TRINITY_DN15664_c0_g1_i2.p1 TRINITY_DN15664_c0_g1~~TRINITY_DN15664_c0_g1_i2.p1  ORF type:complete len:432 (+),score=35.81 TRINITY_DN15664_c0_g1_i2:83-1378(+)
MLRFVGAAVAAVLLLAAATLLRRGARRRRRSGSPGPQQGPASGLAAAVRLDPGRADQHGAFAAAAAAAAAGRGGPHCPTVQEALLESRRRHSDGTVLVIGANVGVGNRPETDIVDEAPELWWNATLFGASYRKVLVEPVPPIFDALNKHMASSGLQNITLLNVAIGSTPGQTQMWCLSATQAFPQYFGQTCALERQAVIDSIPAMYPVFDSLFRIGKISAAIRNQARRAEKAGAMAASSSAVATAPGGRRLLAAHARGASMRGAAGLKSRRTLPGGKVRSHGPSPLVEERRRISQVKNLRYPDALVNYTVRIVTPPELLRAAAVAPESVRYVQIDVEGGDYAVLQTLPFSPPRSHGAGANSVFYPGVIMWEQGRLSSDDKRRARELMASRGYSVCADCPSGNGSALDACSDLYAVALTRRSYPPTSGRHGD